MMQENKNITTIFSHRLNPSGVVKKGHNSVSHIILDYAPVDSTGVPIEEPIQRKAKIVSAKVFIDSSYEGDLMAMMNVPYTYGRESMHKYGESLAGPEGQLMQYKIDPYKVPGDKKSGLIPLIQDIDPGSEHHPN